VVHVPVDRELLIVDPHRIAHIERDRGQTLAIARGTASRPAM
jgi:hypothetical protein